MSDRRRVLVLCSRNRWRSPTAERIYRGDPRIEVRSAGLSDAAARPVREADVRWAELILVMESEHRRRLIDRFPDAAADADIRVLGIPDDYQYMDPELVELLTAGIEAALAEPDPR